MSTPEYDFYAVILTMAIIIITVGIHYEGLRIFSTWMANTTIQPRLRIMILIHGLLFLHSVEIWVFGTGYWWMAKDPGFGILIGDTPLNHIVDYVYFSTTVYSTLGFGDLVPQGSVRLLVGIESVLGLLMITWSASFTYLEMIRYWREDN